MLRRIVTWALALLALTGAALGETLCIHASGVAALTDAQGNELLPAGSVEDIFTVRENALYAAGSPGAYRLYDAEGRVLGDATFSMIDDAGYALVFREGTLYGALNDDGSVLLPARWTQLTADGEGGWLALDGDPWDEQADEIIHLDGDGAARRTGVYTASGLSPVACGRMPYLGEEGRYGAVDAEGRPAIAAVWRYIGPFKNGCARVSGPKGMGLIDAAGVPVISPVYTWLERGEGLVAACGESGLDVYGPNGGVRRFHLPGPVGEVLVTGRCLVVADESQSRLYGAWGALLAQGEAGTLWTRGTLGQFIASRGEWGEKSQWLVNPDGGVASGRYRQILPLCAGRYAWLEMKGVEYYSAGLNRLQKSWDYGNMRYGLMDGAGRVLLPARYREIRALGANRLLLIGDGAVQLADKNGAVLKTWVTPETEAPSGEGAGESTP